MELLLAHTPDDTAGARPAIDLEVVAKRKQTALHLASDHGEDEAVEVPIRYGANLEAVDAHGDDTPLDLADNEEIREMLLEALEAKRAGEEAAAEVAQEAAEAEAAAEVVAEAEEAAAAATTKEGKVAGEGVLGYAALVAENAALKGEVARLRAGVRAQAEAMRALLI